MKNKRAIIGIALVGLGLFFLLRSLNVIWFGFDELLWRLLPFALIALGIHFILKRRHRSDSPRDELHPDFTVEPNHTASRQSTDTRPESEGTSDREQSRVSAAPSSSEEGKTKFSKMIGDLRIDCNNLNLKSVEVSAFLGDIEVTLLGGRLQSGLNRMIISDFIGDIRILVPKGMPTYVHCSNFIGDIDIFGKRTSGFGNHIEGQTQDYPAATDKLFIAVSSFIADIRVYYV